MYGAKNMARKYLLLSDAKENRRNQKVWRLSVIVEIMIPDQRNGIRGQNRMKSVSGNMALSYVKYNSRNLDKNSGID